MASLKFMLGLIPSTSKIEQTEKALISEFEKLQQLASSEKLAKFTKLKDIVESSGFIQKKKEIISLKYKESQEYSKEKEFLSLQKARDLVLYFKTLSGPDLKSFRQFESSEKIRNFEALEKFISATDFKAKKKADKKHFRESEEYKKLIEYKNLKSSPDIKGFYKFKSSKELANYLATEKSARLTRYNELKEYLATDEFRNRKTYLLDSKRYEKSEMFREEQEFQALKKSDDIVWYFKTKDSDKFNILKTRTLTFHDEFEGDRLDSSKWITNYYWGEKLLKDNYSVDTDLQAYTKDNFEVRNSVLRIITKPQKQQGKAWSADKGFYMKEFSYTSGLINSGSSFRQKYGIFSAKVKLGDPHAKHGFWMLSDRITPHIDVCRTGQGKVWFDYFSSKGARAMTALGSRYANDFFIYTLEWTSGSLVWKINNTEVFRQTSDVPQEPMYVIFSGGLEKAVGSVTSLEVDWIRVYQPK
jgi:beta-glucanase (GH16 family)